MSVPDVICIFFRRSDDCGVLGKYTWKRIITKNVLA